VYPVSVHYDQLEEAGFSETPISTVKSKRHHNPESSVLGPVYVSYDCQNQRYNRISSMYFLYEVGTEFFHIIQPVVSLQGVK